MLKSSCCNKTISNYCVQLPAQNSHLLAMSRGMASISSFQVDPLCRGHDFASTETCVCRGPPMRLKDPANTVPKKQAPRDLRFPDGPGNSLYSPQTIIETREMTGGTPFFLCNPRGFGVSDLQRGSYLLRPERIHGRLAHSTRSRWWMMSSTQVG